MALDPTILPDAFLRKMAPADRKALGRSGLTQAERDAKGEAKAEKVLQNRVEALLRLKNITANRSRMDRKTTNRKGWPDFTFAIRGQAIAFECKVGDATLSFDQLKIMDGLIMDGWTYRVIRSEQAVVDFLRENL